MSTAESRTTKRARALVSDVRVAVAVPAELQFDEAPQPKKRGFKALITSSISPSADPGARVLAFTRSGTIIMTTKSSNGGIPDEISAQTESFPEVIDDSGSELIIGLDDGTYRVSAIHRDTTLSAIAGARLSEEPEVNQSDLVEPETSVSEPTVSEADVSEAEVDDTHDDVGDVQEEEEREVDDSAIDDLEEQDVEQEMAETHDDVEAQEVQAQEDPAQDTADTLDEPETLLAPAEPEPAEPSAIQDAVLDESIDPAQSTEAPVGARAAAAAATSGMTAAGIAASLKRTFLTDEFGEIEIETRSRPTMQCQRLLRDRYVYLSVPGKAQPREGTDQPKGNALLAFTDEGVMLFKPSRGNVALPRDVIGPIESTPITFEPAGYNDKQGGVLTVGSRDYVISRPYVKSVMTHLAEFHDGPRPLP